MVGQFPAFILWRFRPLLARILWPDFKAHPESVIKQHADLVDDSAPDE